jgi:four helix bundle protein
MTIKQYRDLVCWQLSSHLRDSLLEILARPKVSRDRRFCDQLGDAIRSAPSNMSEGFGRSNREFAHYLEMSYGSLREAETLMDEALAKRYVSAMEYEQSRRLAKRASVATARLLGYLRRRTRERRPKQPTRSNPLKPDPT